MDDIAMPIDFFYTENCILCLETSPADSHNIYSIEGKQLGIEQIIVKYFWLQPNEDDPKSRCICRQCWGSLYSFHEFYIRVERVHKRLNETNELFESSLLKDPFEEEVHVKTQTDEDEPLLGKRLQVRSCKQSQIQIDRSKKMMNVENVNTETKLKAATKIGKSSSRMDKQNQIVTEVGDIKFSRGKIQENNTLEEDGIKTEYNTTTPDTTTDEPLINELKLKKKEKQCIQSKKYDEYIAENFNLTCCICNIKVTKFNMLIKHHLSEHQQRGYAVCCDKKFYRRLLLVDHIQSHTNPQHYRCPHCNKEWSTRHNYELHLKRHDEKLQAKYRCEICSKAYSKKSYYTRHMLIHVPDRERNVKCTQCERTFHTQNQMEQHYAHSHLRLYAKICDVCGKFISGKKAFQHHMEKHSGIAQPIHQCETCGIKITDKYQLNKHVKEMHSAEGQMPKTCDICGKISPGLSAHRHHIYYVHKLKHVHTCTFCDKTFKQPTKLREHMTTHTGDILYTCTYCPKTFNSNANMYSHRKRAHQKQWEENRLQKYSKIKEPEKNA